MRSTSIDAVHGEFGNPVVLLESSEVEQQLARRRRARSQLTSHRARLPAAEAARGLATSEGISPVTAYRAALADHQAARHRALRATLTLLLAVGSSFPFIRWTAAIAELSLPSVPWA